MELQIVAIVTAMARAEELKQVAELIRLEGRLSHDMKIVVGDKDGTPLRREQFLSLQQGLPNIANDSNSFRFGQWRCNAVDDQTGEECGFVCRWGANLEDIEGS